MEKLPAPNFTEREGGAGKHVVGTLCPGNYLRMGADVSGVQVGGEMKRGLDGAVEYIEAEGT